MHEPLTGYQGKRIAFGPYIYEFERPLHQKDDVILDARPIRAIAGASNDRPQSAALSEWRFATRRLAMKTMRDFSRSVRLPLEAITFYTFVVQSVAWSLIFCSNLSAPLELECANAVHSNAISYRRWCGPLIPALWVETVDETERREDDSL